MSDCMRALRVCLCLVPLHVAVVSLFAGTEGTPSELSKSDWTKIRQQHERHRRAAFPVGGEYHARNPRDRWLARFDRRGFLVTPDGKDWTWGLQLLSYGFGNSLHTLTGKAHATTDVEHVNYTWNSALEEWFINGQEGLEHGFTLRKRPGGLSNPSAPLVLNIAVRGDLRPRVYADSSGVSFTDRQEIALVEYAGLKVWDADNKPVVARFEVAGAYLRLLVEEHAAKYPLTIDPVAQGSYLKASNAETDDGFGVSVAIDGDTVVVGALAEKSGAAGVNGNDNDNSIHAAGAAYVFVRQHGAWSQQAYLKASNPGDQDLFGFSVAISGDTVVVGAEQESSGSAGVNADQDNNSKPLSGAAYVFVRTAGVWSQQAYLKASNPDALDQFGRSVAISGDTIVVGANQEGSTATIINGDQSDNSGHVVGAAYVFVRNGSAWSQQAYLKPSSESHHFGISVAAAGDTVAVGAFETADAYVFVRSGDAWSEQAHLTYPDLQSNFGASVALSGETLVIGAPWAVENNGAAYVYVRSGGTWRPQAELGASHSGTSSPTFAVQAHFLVSCRRIAFAFNVRIAERGENRLSEDLTSFLRHGFLACCC